MQKIINLDFNITHKKELRINQRNDTNVITNQKQTHREGNYDSQGEGWREGRVRKFGMDMYTLLYLKWITSKDLLLDRELFFMFCGSLDGRGVQGRMDTCICLAESLCWAPENITALLMSYACLHVFSCVQLFATPWTVAPPASSVHGRTGVGCNFLLQFISYTPI